MTYIYLVENCFGDPNKIYIGKTITSRKSAHVIKFGNQITYTIIDQIESLNTQDWKPIETMWIQSFICWGFDVLNKNNGGGGPITHTEEISNIIRNKKIGVPQKLETINKRSKTLKNRVITWGNKISQNKKGRIQSQEEKEKRSKSLQKSVLQYDLEGNFIKEWSSIKEASKTLKCDVNAQLLGKQKTAGGFIWKYKE